MPWGKNLFPEEQSPWCIPLLRPLLLGILLTLGDGVHHMVTTTAQGRHLHTQYLALYYLLTVAIGLCRLKMEVAHKREGALNTYCHPDFTAN